VEVELHQVQLEIVCFQVAHQHYQVKDKINLDHQVWFGEIVCHVLQPDLLAEEEVIHHHLEEIHHREHLQGQTCRPNLDIPMDRHMPLMQIQMASHLRYHT